MIDKVYPFYALATLEYNGQQRTVEIGYDEREAIEFHWEDGNYGCDCNRSIFMFGKEHEMPCGDKIKLIKLEILTKDEYSERQKPDSCAS